MRSMKLLMLPAVSVTVAWSGAKRHSPSTINLYACFFCGGDCGGKNRENMTLDVRLEIGGAPDLRERADVREVVARAV